jgi:Cu/Ag efflux protein CusF
MKIRSTAIVLAIAAGAGAGVGGQAFAQAAGAQGQGVVATAPGAALAAGAVKATATVTAIDAANRVITLKREDGTTFNVTAGEEVRNFAQIKVGDLVTAGYARALTLELKKVGGATPAAAGASTAIVRAKPGEKPAGSIARQVTLVGTVVGIDAQKKLVTLRGTEGNVVDLEVKDPAQLALVAKGDKVEAVYTEAIAVKVEAGPKAGAK